MSNIKSWLRKVTRPFRSLTFSSSKNYWDKRYSCGGNSGAGSYGEVADNKAQVFNQFVKENNIQSVIDWGCGDGNQLKLLECPSYIGLDVSPTIIKKNVEEFKDSPSKSFFLNDPKLFLDNNRILKAELAISMEVIFHLIEDKVFEEYMHNLFNSATKCVMIYSTNTNKNDNRAPHYKNRKFTDFIDKYFDEWYFVGGEISDPEVSGFYVYERRNKQ